MEESTERSFLDSVKAVTGYNYIAAGLGQMWDLAVQKFKDATGN